MLYWYGTNIINRFVNGGVSVEVGTELDTMCLTPVNDTWWRRGILEVLTSIESHVLKEVGQASLVRFFENTPHTLCNVEVGNSFLLSIVAYVISHTVLQLSYAEAVVGADILRHSTCHEEQEYKRIDDSFVH